jgi:hypothetical protein
LIQTKDIYSSIDKSLSSKDKNLSILEKMINYLKDRQKSILENSDYDYLSLEELSNLIRKDPNLPDYLKKRIILNYNLKDLFSNHSEVTNPRAYLSPVVSIESNKILSKIYVMSPLKGNSKEVEDFHFSCFLKSKNAINLLVSKKILSSKTLNEKNFINSLIRQNRIDEKYFYPYEHCLEEELRSLARRSFTPYQYISIDAFIEKVISFGKANNKLIEITPDYHICNTDLIINSEGLIEREPEIYYHLFSHLSSLEQILKNDFYQLTSSFGMILLTQEIDTYNTKFNSSFSKNPQDELVRAFHLTDIILSFPAENFLPEKERKFIRSLKVSAEILRKITQIFPIYETKRTDFLLSHCTQKFRNSLFQYSSEKKELMQLFLNDIIIYAHPRNESQKFFIEKELRKIILQEYGSYEVLCDNGEKLLYLLDPGFIHRVIFSLSILGQKDEQFRIQYFIASNILKQLKSKNKPINFKLNPNELEEIEREIPRIDKLLIKQQKNKNMIEFLLTIYVFLINVACIGYLGFLKITFALPIKELLLLPFGIVIGWGIRTIFSFKLKKGN